MIPKLNFQNSLFFSIHLIIIIFTIIIILFI